ncbi:hypothetical protein B0T18DRAFT_249132 [Schizothecium vesticola]|uniref:Uncharacterized protein n=1 Tax=Schizothecium vesticola TaxID=314040 RepID=A0AA40EIK0_9PEZI|nr:hypothetical protein B0T18DRAFT_249132 [Schizothecium vesticola]
MRYLGMTPAIEISSQLHHTHGATKKIRSETIMTCPPSCFGLDCIQGRDCRGPDCVEGGDCVRPPDGHMAATTRAQSASRMRPRRWVQGRQLNRGWRVYRQPQQQGWCLRGQELHQRWRLREPEGAHPEASRSFAVALVAQVLAAARGASARNVPEMIVTTMTTARTRKTIDPACAASGILSGFSITDTPDSKGGTVSGGMGAGSGSGGSAGQGRSQREWCGTSTAFCTLAVPITTITGGGSSENGTDTRSDFPMPNTGSNFPMPTSIPDGPDYTGTGCSTYSRTLICSGSGGRQEYSTRQPLCADTDDHVHVCYQRKTYVYWPERDLQQHHHLHRCQQVGVTGGVPPTATVHDRALLTGVEANAPAMLITHDIPAPTPAPVL